MCSKDVARLTAVGVADFFYCDDTEHVSRMKCTANADDDLSDTLCSTWNWTKDPMTTFGPPAVNGKTTWACLDPKSGHLARCPAGTCTNGVCASPAWTGTQIAYVGGAVALTLLVVVVLFLLSARRRPR
jgi:hypothetical protein